MSGEKSEISETLQICLPGSACLEKNLILPCLIVDAFDLVDRSEFPEGQLAQVGKNH